MGVTPSASQYVEFMFFSTRSQCVSFCVLTFISFFFDCLAFWVWLVLYFWCYERYLVGLFDFEPSVLCGYGGFWFWFRKCSSFVWDCYVLRVHAFVLLLGCETRLISSSFPPIFFLNCF